MTLYSCSAHLMHYVVLDPGKKTLHFIDSKQGGVHKIDQYYLDSNTYFIFFDE